VTETFKELVNDFFILLKTPDFIKYIIKCLIGTAVCFGLYKAFPQHQLNWSIISVLLVLAPDKADSIRLANDRMKANIIGAGIGLFAFLIHKPDLFVLSVSVTAVILVCYFLKLVNPSRSALAALVIVLIQEEGYNTGSAAVERMACVIIGCVVGLIITYLFAITGKNSKHPHVPGGETLD
jgi:uncharacterized membrane protein YgaE (UPF0421/DUF939 family)